MREAADMPQPSTEQGCQVLRRIQVLMAAIADQISTASQPQPHGARPHDPWGLKKCLERTWVVTNLPNTIRTMPIEQAAAMEVAMVVATTETTTTWMTRVMPHKVAKTQGTSKHRRPSPKTASLSGSDLLHSWIESGQHQCLRCFTPQMLTSTMVK